MRHVSDRIGMIRALIARQPDRTGGAAGLLGQVCLAAVHALSASGAGASVLTDDGLRGASAASDADSERLEELQFVLGEGPCLEAFGSRRPVLVANLDNRPTDRWPVYAAAAYEGGIRAVFAFPLQVGAARLGVLDVFRDRAGALTTDELASALVLADVTVAALLDRQEDLGAAGAVDASAVAHRAELFQAQGMVMVQLGVTIGEALARIRAYAYAENRRLSDVARDVVARRLRFDQDH